MSQTRVGLGQPEVQTYADCCQQYAFMNLCSTVWLYMWPLHWW